MDTLKKTGKPEHSIAVIDDKGHAYSTVIFAGKFKDDELPFLSGADDWSTPNQLICAFAPSGRHLPKKWATRVDTLPNYEHGVLELEPVVSGQPDELEIEEFQHSLVEKNSFDGLVALGSSTIERSHFDSAEDERVRVWSYIATTHRFDHVLDGYAEHRPVLDKSDSSLYFVANGEGQHAWRSVDGANNPIALFVFSVMARSFFRYIQLQAKRKRENLPPLDIVRYRAEALRELRRYIATVDPQLAKDRRRAAVLDFLGRWIPLVRLIFGANVVQAPPEFTLPGDSTKTATGTGSGSGGTGGDSGSEGTVSQTGPADQSDSFSLWPFLLIVVLLAIDDDDDEDDEEDLDSFFVDLDKESTT